MNSRTVLGLSARLSAGVLVASLAASRAAWAQESELAALRSAPASDPGAQLRLGRALRRAGRFDEALRALRTATRGPTRADALYEIARVRFDQQNFREARSACSALPAGVMRHVCLARAHLIWQRPALAEREITAAQRLEPQNAELKLVIAESLRISGRTTEAEGAFREAIAALPGRPEPHLGMAHLLETANRLDEARQAFQRAVDADPKDPIAALALGRLLRRMQQNDAALPLLQRASAERPDWPDALVALGELYLARNALDDAQRALARAVQLNPMQPGAQSALGRVHLRAGRLQEAEPALRTAIQQVANDAEARAALAELLGRTDRGEESLEEWNRAIDLMPSDPTPRMRAAEQARRMRLNTLARAYLDRILSDDAQHAPALLLRADIAFEEGDRRSARQLYQQALAGRGDIDRSHAQGRIQEIDNPQRQRRR
jgi:tetratricopeptide (TPR) repeat protein